MSDNLKRERKKQLEQPTARAEDVGLNDGRKGGKISARLEPAIT